MAIRKNVTSRRAGRQLPPPAESKELRHKIALRAYDRYCERGRIDGFDLEDWLAAEREVLQEHSTVAGDPSTRPRSGTGTTVRNRARSAER